MQVLCSWNLCNQPNRHTSFKSLKLGFAMGSLAEKLIHFVTKRSIHEFFSQLLTSLNFVAICKGGLIMYLLLLKINFQNLKFRSYWLSYFIFFHPLFCPISSYILSYSILFHPISGYWLLYKHMIRPKVPGKSLVSRHRHHFKLIMSKGSFLHPLRD